MTDSTPINSVYGAGNVSKSSIRSYEDGRNVVIYDDPAALLAVNAGTQYIVYIKSLRAFFRRDTSDTTTATDGATVLADGASNLWKRVNAQGLSVDAVGSGASGGDRDDYDSEDTGFVYVDDDTGNAYIKASSTDADWSDAIPLKGDTGAKGDKGDTGATGPAGASSLTRCRAVATANVDLSSGLAAGQTVDGVTLVAGERVLVTGQTDDAENGVYTVPASGAASRDTDFDAYDDHPGVFFIVQEGTTNADTLWQCTSDTGGTLDTDDITISEFSGGDENAATAAAVIGDGHMVVGDGGSRGIKAHASGAPGTAAFKDTGTSGNKVPLLDGANTFSAIQKVSDATQASTVSDGALQVAGGVSIAKNLVVGGARLITSVDGANTFWYKTLGGSETTNLIWNYTTDGSSKINTISFTPRNGGGLLIATDRLTCSFPLKVKSYTVTTLPTGQAGDTAFASDLRVFNGAGTQEGASSGTGGLVSHNGTAWKIAGTNITAIA